jgi:hypothetical protein
MCSDCWVTTTTTYVSARGALLLCASSPRVPDRLQVSKNRESESGRVDGTAEAAGFTSIPREGRGPQPRRPLLLPPRDGGTVPAATRVGSRRTWTWTDLARSRRRNLGKDIEIRMMIAGPRHDVCSARVRAPCIFSCSDNIYLSSSPHCRPDQALDRAVSMCPSCTFLG